ncbi:MAG: copper ABC transporter permease [Deltaproteobacteria bacterium RBG_13_65_10]|nr:MAG: copper ABC transporter permease [Deltaproteobacteria bacterium RBG_13_65_10]
MLVRDFDPRTVLTLARKELRDALRSRWFILYAVAFAVLALGLSALSLGGADLVGFAAFGRAAGGLINLVALIVPLMALTIGAQSVAGEAERGTLGLILAQPVSRAEVLAGKFLGAALALLGVLTAGFGVSSLILGASAAAAAPPGLLAWLIGTAFLFGLAMLAVGFLISTTTTRAGVAIAVATFTWLGLVLLGDLGLMGSALMMKLSTGTLLGLAISNPVQAFKITALIGLNATLDLLGPAGMYAVTVYGRGLARLLLAILLAWTLVPLLVSGLIFGRRSVR